MVIIGFLLAVLIWMSVLARRRGVAYRNICIAAWSSVRTVGMILVIFLLIGVLTAMWRASGCIPTIVCWLAGWIAPSMLLPAVFLMNVLVSVLTGTAFGTAATMGTISMAIAQTMGASPLWTGGAILSGCYFGDRWSPVSTSALLVSTLTQTNLYDNLRWMIRTMVLPLVLAVIGYWLLGRGAAEVGEAPELSQLFAVEFELSWLCVLPALAVVVLSLCRVHVRWTILVSIAIAAAVAIGVQKLSIATLLQSSICGYHARNAEVESLINGGGLVSMLRVTAIVCIAAVLSGLARAAGYVERMSAAVHSLASRLGRYGATLAVSFISSAIACNQTLAIVLTYELTAKLYPIRSEQALDLEDSAVIVTPLIPWAIASGVVLDAVGAPLTAIAGALYLMLLPLCRLLTKQRRQLV